MWRTDVALDFVIEAKHEKDENPLYKKDHAQLLEAEHWVKTTYPGRETLRVSAIPQAVADQKATATGTYALRLDDINKIVGALREVLTEMTTAPGDEAVLRDAARPS